MSIDFDRLCLIMLFENATAAVLSTCMGLGGWWCLSSSSVVWIGNASLVFRKVAPILVSVAEDMTVLMILHRVWMGMLLVGRVIGLLSFFTSWSESKNILRIRCG